MFLSLFYLQETKSWDAANLTLPGCVCYGSKFGLATLLVSNQFCTIKRSWTFEERCTAILFGTTLVMAAYAPDSSKDMEMYEAFLSGVLEVLRGGRRGGAREFHITRDLNVELGMMCTDEKDIEELNEMYGRSCWQGYDHDPGGFKKLTWYGIMKEFNCKATSTWSKCGRAKETAFTHRQLGDKRQEWKSQLDYIIGPRERDDDVDIHNDVKLWDTWDHYPIYGVIQEGKSAEHFPEKKRTKKLTGWRPRTEAQKIELKK